MKEMKRYFQIRLWGLVMAAGFFASVATVFGFLGRWSWFFDLFDHFRMQYGLALLIAGFWMLACKHKKVATLYLLLSLVNFYCVLPLFLPRPNVSPLDYPFGTHRVLLMNIHSELGNPERVLEVIREEKPELVVLEEVTAAWMQQLRALTNAFPYSIASPREDNFGIALFSRHPFVSANVLLLGEAEVPSLGVSVKLDGRVVDFLATHPLPPVDAEYASLRNEQMERVAECVQGRSPLLLLGDLNMTPWSASFKRLLAQSGLQDSGRGFGYQPSWPSHLARIGIPIDHGLHTGDIYVKSRRVGPHVGSDHLPLIVDFTLHERSGLAK